MSSPSNEVIGAVQGWCSTEKNRQKKLCGEFMDGNAPVADQVVHLFAHPEQLVTMPGEVLAKTGLPASKLRECLEQEESAEPNSLCVDARRVRDVVEGALGREAVQSAQRFHPDRVTQAAHETAARTAAEVVMTRTSNLNGSAASPVVRVQDQINARSRPDADAGATYIPPPSADSVEIATLYDRQDVSRLMMRCSQQGVPLTEGLIQLARQRASTAAALCKTENCKPRQFCLDIIEAAIDQDNEAYVGEILDICGSEGLDPASMKTKEEASVTKLVVSHFINNPDKNKNPEHFCDVVRAKTILHGYRSQDEAMMVGDMLSSIM